MTFEGPFQSKTFYDSFRAVWWISESRLKMRWKTKLALQYIRSLQPVAILSPMVDRLTAGWVDLLLKFRESLHQRHNATWLHVTYGGDCDRVHSCIAPTVPPNPSTFRDPCLQPDLILLMISVISSTPLESLIHPFHTENPCGRSIAFSEVTELKGVISSRRDFTAETSALLINKLAVAW